MTLVQTRAAHQRQDIIAAGTEFSTKENIQISATPVFEGNLNLGMSAAWE
jgi:hypothetical protein